MAVLSFHGCPIAVMGVLSFYGRPIGYGCPLDYGCPLSCTAVLCRLRLLCHLWPFSIVYGCLLPSGSWVGERRHLHHASALPQLGRCRGNPCASPHPSLPRLVLADLFDAVVSSVVAICGICIGTDKLCPFHTLGVHVIHAPPSLPRSICFMCLM